MKKVLLAGVLAVSMVVSNAFADGETGVGAGGAAAGTTVGATSIEAVAIPAAIIAAGVAVAVGLASSNTTTSHH